MAKKRVADVLGTFFRKVVALEARYRKPHQRIENDLQTNGTLLEHGFLVGLSCDGPKRLAPVLLAAKTYGSVFYDKFGPLTQGSTMRRIRHGAKQPLRGWYPQFHARAA
jgi:hypothetical protein